MYETGLGVPGSTTGSNIGVLTGMVDFRRKAAGTTKLETDQYEVFVNGDKVGDKKQLTQVEEPEDLEPYLKKYGFDDFDYRVVGGHIEINTVDDSAHMKEILSSYLSLR